HAPDERAARCRLFLDFNLHGGVPSNRCGILAPAWRAAYRNGGPVQRAAAVRGLVRSSILLISQPSHAIGEQERYMAQKKKRKNPQSDRQFTPAPLTLAEQARQRLDEMLATLEL